MTSGIRPRRTDGGFTLVELLIVISLMGLVITVLSSAIIVILRTAPTTELRIDDARSTRGLATWLSHDVASTPPFEPPQGGRGGFDLSDDVNTCGAPEGTNRETLVELRWVHLGLTYVATYRAESDGSGPTSVRRYTCSGSGPGSFSAPTTVNMTSGLAPVSAGGPGVVELTKIDGDVAIVKFRLIGRSGETVLLDISSRNPSEFFG